MRQIMITVLFIFNFSRYEKKKKIDKTLSLSHFLIKSVCFSAIVFAIVLFIEKKKIFQEDNVNNHIEWKWDGYYRLKEEKIPVDILFVGNSHILTGINPYMFSKNVGLNSFIMGAPGVSVGDLYYSIEEAITVRKPKVIVLETYAINDYEQLKLSGGSLNNQIDSFRGRKNSWLKFKSMFSLFARENYLIAWVELFRNHNFIFTKPDQIKRNIKSGGPVKREAPKGVYLGQFSRFTEGLSEKTLKRYKKEGAPVNGADYRISRSSIRYTRKIAELCRKNDIKLVFLTVPMYDEHIEYYYA